VNPGVEEQGVQDEGVDEPSIDETSGLLEIRDGPTRWRFDTAFLNSNWTCIWGRGCLGIEDRPAEHLGHGCCSVGAELNSDDDGDEVRNIAALALYLKPQRFQFHAEARAGGVLTAGTTGGTATTADSHNRAASPTATRVVDGACIFLNRPGFAGGAGCALHLAALDAGESPIDWKPSVCWQLPIHVDWQDHADGTETATVRRWTRADWGETGESMAWCCTQDRAPTDAYVGDRPVVESLAEELRAIVGEPVFVQLTRRLRPDARR
jgi:hypothetical protein